MELNGLIAIFDLLKSDLKKDTTEDDKLKKGILKKFSRIGFEIEDLFIKSNSIGKVIEVIKPACRKERECINVVLPIISNQTRTEYMLYSIDCANDLNKMEKESVCYNEQVKCLDCDCRMCKIKMIPTVKYCVEIDVVEKAKCEGQINGDSYMVKLLDDGRLAIAISDGMGTGVSASKESKAAIRMLSRLLEIGVTSEFAVQTVNLMMFARSRQDSFTTLDLSVIDLLTGNVQIIKAGAPPSIVKKRKTVRIVGEHSLPAGVFIPIEIQKEELILSENDIMIMMSDGVKEGDFSEVDWNKKANKVLVHVGDACVSEINRALLNLNKFSYKRQEKRTDDLTILTVRLKLVNKENATMFPVIFVRDNMYIRNMVETTPRFAG